MNDPMTKYASKAPPEDLVFFNYHEFLVADYATLPSQDSQENINQNESALPSLVINHFPNPYAPQDSNLYDRTRIVRIPRIFDTCDELYIIPQFSTFLPGKEPAAMLSASVECYKDAGIYTDRKFGTTSFTPLVPRWLSAEELLEIVETVNKHVYTACSSSDLTSVLESLLDILTGSLFTVILSVLGFKSAPQRKMLALEQFVTEKNLYLALKHPDLKLIPLAESAMLSLDFQIPMLKREKRNTD